MQVEVTSLKERVSDHDFWLDYLGRASEPLSPIGIHLAVFAQPFLSLVLQGRKTVESRITRNRCAPYGEIADGDVILIKQMAGPICGLALAEQTWFYDLATEPLDRIRLRYGSSICADDGFWSSRQDAAYATLIRLAEIVRIAPLPCDKRDRRGWVSLRPRQLSFAF
jgi:hypothetical protein